MIPFLASAAFDFGYPWWLSYGHASILLPAAALLTWGYFGRWRKGPMIVLSALVLWSGLALLVVRFGFHVNGQPALPTANFFPGGRGRVLDIGAGTGRSSIMVLQSRPEANLVALDLFGPSFEEHFGKGESPQERLLSNLRLAGVDRRVTLSTADMRRLPFEPSTFDAVVSAYAMDHLNREGSAQAIAEAARVLKPGGDFLLILVGNDAWAKFCFGPLLTHGGTRGEAWWSARLGEAGFEVREHGTQPLTLFLLARRH